MSDNYIVLQMRQFREEAAKVGPKQKFEVIDKYWPVNPKPKPLLEKVIHNICRKNQ